MRPKLFFPRVPPLVTARSLKSDFSKSLPLKELKRRIERAWLSVGVKAEVKIERGQLHIRHINGVAY